jgi:hypothetical protein
VAEPDIRDFLQELKDHNYLMEEKQL